MICKTDELAKEVTNIKETLSVLLNEQEKLTELIPLSAAASGMMVGERQIGEIQKEIQKGFLHLRTELQNDTNIAESPNRRTGGFHWGGKFRIIPKDFILNCSYKNTSYFWNVWWNESYDSEGKCIPPYRNCSR